MGEAKLRENEWNGISIWHSGPFSVPVQYLWENGGVWFPHNATNTSIQSHPHAHTELLLTGYLWRHIYWWSPEQTWRGSWRSECSRVGPSALHQDHPSSPLREKKTGGNDAWIKTLHPVAFLSCLCLLHTGHGSNLNEGKIHFIRFNVSDGMPGYCTFSAFSTGMELFFVRTSITLKWQ